MSNKFYTSDLHFGHANIIEYCDRPFKNVDIMDRELIKNWNSVVSKEDIVHILGDFTLRGKQNYPWFEETLGRLKGTKILVLGNHDKLNAMKYVDLGFHQVVTHLVDGDLFMAHDPAWATAMPSDSGMKMLCGHVHKLFKYLPEQKVLNVGVDVWNYIPVSEDEVRKWLAKSTGDFLND